MNKTEWTFRGKDENVEAILKGIDKMIVKTQTDTALMERALEKSMKGSARSVDYLRDKLKKLTVVRDNAFDEKTIARYNMELRKTEAQINRLNNLGISRRQQFTDGLSQSGIGGSLLGMGSNPYVMAGLATVAAGRFASQSVTYGRGFNTDMAKINATAQITPQRLMALRESFFPMANKIGVDVNQMASSYESIISATGDKEMADKIFDPAIKLSKAGFTDATVTGKALSQIMMTPGVNMNQNQIADMLMSAKNYGRGELGDFANYLPGLISTGKLRGFKEQEVTGAYSYLTRSNSAEQASTLMSNFMNVVLRKDVTDEIRKRIKVDVFEKDGSLKSMSEILKEIGKSMNGLSDKGKQSFLDAIKVVDQQAFQALGALTSETDKLDEAIRTVTDSAGTLNKTLGYTKDGNEELVKFNNNMAQLKLRLADALLPGINSGLKWINGGGIKDITPGYHLYRKLSGKAAEEQDIKNKESINNAAMFAQGQATDYLNKYSDLSPQDRATAALKDITSALGSKGIKTDATWGKAANKYLLGLANGQTTSSTATLEDKLKEFGSESPDKAIKEHRQVRNVTVNIDTLQKIEQLMVANNKELQDMTSEDSLNGLLKVIRDAEQSLNTY
jgi:hypothetical protein